MNDKIMSFIKSFYVFFAVIMIFILGFWAGYQQDKFINVCVDIIDDYNLLVEQYNNLAVKKSGVSPFNFTAPSSVGFNQSNCYVEDGYVLCDLDEVLYK